MEENKINKKDELDDVIDKMVANGEFKNILDIQEKLKKSFGKVIQSMLEAEMTEHLGYNKSQYTEEEKLNYRNGHSKKKLKSNFGQLDINIPRDRKCDFEPVLVPKHSTDISDIESQIIKLYGMGNSTREISKFVEEIYGFSVSAEMVSNITDRILPEIDEWKSRRLDEVYPFVFIDAIHFNVKTNGTVGKSAAYVVVGISKEGIKDVLGIYIGENETSRFWMTVFNDLKNRGIKDILILSSDGLTGIKDTISTAFPNTDHQTCLVHMTRNTLKYVSYKDKRLFAQDLKAIYTSSTEEIGHKLMLEVQNKWSEKYPTAMNRWEENWGIICPFFKFSQKIRKMIYTTNTIESLNSGYRRLNKSRNVYTSIQSLYKVLYLSTMKITKNWKYTIIEWGETLRELEIMYENRI